MYILISLARIPVKKYFELFCRAKLHDKPKPLSNRMLITRSLNFTSKVSSTISPNLDFHLLTSQWSSFPFCIGIVPTQKSFARFDVNCFGACVVGSLMLARCFWKFRAFARFDTIRTSDRSRWKWKKALVCALWAPNLSAHLRCNMAVVIRKLCLGSLKLVCLAHAMPSPALQKMDRLTWRGEAGQGLLDLRDQAIQKRMTGLILGYIMLYTCFFWPLHERFGRLATLLCTWSKSRTHKPHLQALSGQTKIVTVMRIVFRTWSYKDNNARSWPHLPASPSPQLSAFNLSCIGFCQHGSNEF